MRHPMQSSNKFPPISKADKFEIIFDSLLQINRECRKIQWACRDEDPKQISQAHDFANTFFKAVTELSPFASAENYKVQS